MGRGDETIDYSKIIVLRWKPPRRYGEDFIIEMSPVTGGFINVSAIQSPGPAPAIAKRVEQIVVEAAAESGTPGEKTPMESHRQRKPNFGIFRAEQDALIQRDPPYGRIICRCETVTEEMLEISASHARQPVGDQRRTPAGSGTLPGRFLSTSGPGALAKERGALDRLH